MNLLCPVDVAGQVPHGVHVVIGAIPYVQGQIIACETKVEHRLLPDSALSAGSFPLFTSQASNT